MSTPQRTWQVLQQLAGNCIICGIPFIDGYHCLEHKKKKVERTRKIVENQKAKGLCIWGKCPLKRIDKRVIVKSIELDTEN